MEVYVLTSVYSIEGTIMSSPPKVYESMEKALKAIEREKRNIHKNFISIPDYLVLHTSPDRYYVVDDDSKYLTYITKVKVK